MSLEIILSIAAQVATWVTVFVALLTLRETQKQRQESYKPLIVVPRFSLKSKGKPDGNVISFRQLYRGPLVDIETNDELKKELEKTLVPRAVHVMLQNVGLGAAKNIIVEWRMEFDFVEQVNRVRDFCYRNSIPIVVEIDQGNLSVRESFTPERNFPAIYRFEHQKEFDYLLPRSVDPSGITVQFPQLYERLIGLLGMIYKNQQVDPQLSGLPLMLSIRYQDIGNKKYENQFRLQIVRHLNVRHPTEEIYDLHVSFDVTQIR